MTAIPADLDEPAAFMKVACAFWRHASSNSCISAMAEDDPSSAMGWRAIELGMQGCAMTSAFNSSAS
jgi:hypothetical protein